MCCLSSLASVEVKQQKMKWTLFFCRVKRLRDNLILRTGNLAADNNNLLHSWERSFEKWMILPGKCLKSRWGRRSLPTLTELLENNSRFDWLTEWALRICFTRTYLHSLHSQITPIKHTPFTKKWQQKTKNKPLKTVRNMLSMGAVL